MNPESVLAQLRDIQAPEAISWWPPAIGWWIALVLLTAFVVTSVLLLLRHRKRSAWKRQALYELSLLQGAYLDAPHAKVLAQINALVKRSLACSLKDKEIMALSGDKWHNILLSTHSGLSDGALESLIEGHYRAEHTPLTKNDLKALGKLIRELSL